MRVCPKCGTARPLGMFRVDKRRNAPQGRCRACERAYQREANKTPAGRASMRRYRKSAKGRAKDERHRRSAKGRATQARANKSPAGRASIRRYRQSAKGRATTKRYESSEKSRAHREAYERSEKRRARRAAYNRSEKARAGQAAYNRSEKGRVKKAAYRRSEKGKAAYRAKDHRRRARLAGAYHEPWSRQQVYAQSAGRCVWCNRAFAFNGTWEAAHVIPLARGGADALDNLAVACGQQTTGRRCNQAQGHRMPYSEWLPEVHAVVLATWKAMLYDFWTEVAVSVVMLMALSAYAAVILVKLTAVLPAT